MSYTDVLDRLEGYADSLGEIEKELRSIGIHSRDLPASQELAEWYEQARMLDYAFLYQKPPSYAFSRRIRTVIVSLRILDEQVRTKEYKERRAEIAQLLENPGLTESSRKKLLEEGSTIAESLHYLQH